MQRHNSLKPFVAEDWLFPLDKAFNIFKGVIAPELQGQKDSGITIFPAEPNVFRAFKETPFSEVRVVIIGQDPYHNTVQSKTVKDLKVPSAVGLCFDNPKTQLPSPSLRNILKEIENDTSVPSLAEINSLSYLEHLPSQGVLLLNAALTVKQGLPESHLALWRDFTAEVIKALNKKEKLVWILWGNKAKAFKPDINSKHVIIEGAHPSPYSYNAYKDGKYFTRANKSLSKPITW